MHQTHISQGLLDFTFHCAEFNLVCTYCFKVWIFRKPQNCSLNDTTGGDTSRLGVAACLLRPGDLEASIYGVIFMPSYGKKCLLLYFRWSYLNSGTDGQTHACC